MPNQALCRLLLSRFLDLRRNLGIVKENRLEKLVSPVKRSAYLHGSTKQKFSWRCFFEVNGIFIIFSREIDVKTGESLVKPL